MFNYNKTTVTHICNLVINHSSTVQLAQSVVWQGMMKWLTSRTGLSSLIISVSCNWAELTLHARPAAPRASPLTTASLINRPRSPNYYLFTSSADRSPTKTSSLLYVLIYVVGLRFMTNLSSLVTSTGLMRGGTNPRNSWCPHKPSACWLFSFM